jgi:hypothetical protein
MKSVAVDLRTSLSRTSKLMGFSILEFSIDQAKQLRATLSRRAVQQEASQDVKLSVSR